MVLVLPKPRLHSFVCWPLLRAPSQQRTEDSDADKVASLYGSSRKGASAGGNEDYFNKRAGEHQRETDNETRQTHGAKNA